MIPEKKLSLFIDIEYYYVYVYRPFKDIYRSMNINAD